jgi:hypothetical protein
VARRNRRSEGVETRPLRGDFQQVEEHPDGDWAVRSISGSAATKTYRCPGCDQEIRPGVPHVVAWPSDRPSGEDDRRHWHTPCWNARGRRGPRTSRGNAPRH